MATNQVPYSDTNHTITTEALETIVTAAVERTKGVTGIINETHRNPLKFGQASSRKGVIVHMQEDNSIRISLRISVIYGENIPQIGETTLHNVREALINMAGLDTEHIHIRIEGITLPDEITKKIF
ncbi:Asp23/Gls24 family envelope stress response protein [Marininema halotolerans]|uniref:Uncharacterized conserved protein YloU, alkaline shock protein (Asp23) family n=1 Tax=Marininema halotolerans TaxID=1155944 RepID=A0A1I6Q0Y7_9BACL|nr:Asp23/Gls24 family envelope stress response protein [Marininema halotolerans]SFS46074.1 Uncharacterized conserved protein YloU, alkaline shock protein (Asp23) family [Marininema halotolerans]